MSSLWWQKYSPSIVLSHGEKIMQCCLLWASSSTLNFFSCNRNRSRSSSTRKTKSYRLKNEDDDDLSENSSSVVVSVESLVRFYVMAKSRPPTEKVLYFVSSIWGDALSIFSDFNARQQHNLPVKVLCNCGWRERDSPHPEIDAASRLEIRICSDIYKKKNVGPK